MRNFFGAVKDRVSDAISPMRYAGGFQTGLYWFIVIGSIVLPILILLVIAGFWYTKANGIEIQFPF